MARSFSSRLFSYFLLFAVVPTLLMAVLGYYVTVDAGRKTYGSNISTAQDISQYHSELLYLDLLKEAETWRLTGIKAFAVAQVVVDFAGDSLAIFAMPDLWALSSTQKLVSSAREHERGYADIGGRYCQYVTALGAHDTLVLAVVHAPEFGKMMAALESMRQQDAGRRELWPRYLAFLGLIFFALSIITVVAATLVSRRTAKQMARPLEELSEAARRIAAGEFKSTVEVSGDKEIRVLIDSFNRMAVELDNMTARLAQSERVAAWRQIAQRFAHELKNPLQPILISLDRIEQQTASSPSRDDIAEPLKAASEEVKHLQQLAERFSQLSKLPAPQCVDTDLCALVRSVAELQREKLAAFRFNVKIPESPVKARVDEGFLREAMHNLLQNAADASRPGGAIELELEAHDEIATIIVRDAGSGMDAKTLAASRLPYFTTKVRGSGLGLAIVERSMSEMGDGSA